MEKYEAAEEMEIEWAATSYPRDLRLCIADLKKKMRSENQRPNRRRVAIQTSSTLPHTCQCTYLYIYVYTHVNTHTYVYVYTHVNPHTYVYVCTHV